MLQVRFKQVYTSNVKYYYINYDEITIKQLYEDLQSRIYVDFRFSKFNLISPKMNQTNSSSHINNEEGTPLNFLSDTYLRDIINKEDCTFMYIYPITIETISHITNLVCIVCMNHNRNRLIEPCNHLSCCSNCINQIMRRNNPICPICRISITNTREIFFS